MLSLCLLQVWMGGTKVVEKGKNVLKKRIGAVIIN